jgi:hypothetical protein
MRLNYELEKSNEKTHSAETLDINDTTNIINIS